MPEPHRRGSICTVTRQCVIDVYVQALWPKSLVHEPMALGQWSVSLTESSHVEVVAQQVLECCCIVNVRPKVAVVAAMMLAIEQVQR
jgi:hypothetical protein